MKDHLLNQGGGKRFLSLLVGKEEMDSVSKEKSSICWLKREKSDTKLRSVIQEKVNLLGPLCWISVGISFFYYHYYYYFLFFFFFLFSLSAWVTALLFFRNDGEVNEAQINVASVTTPFLAQTSPRSGARSSEWINTKLAREEKGGKHGAGKFPENSAAR